MNPKGKGYGRLYYFKDGEKGMIGILTSEMRLLKEVFVIISGIWWYNKFMELKRYTDIFPKCGGIKSVLTRRQKDKQQAV